ncbi:MAG TPA: tripartite tricarboxylate transporter substrate-binding protein [Burkholderiales bacterium]|nr:tripartite tricarboxylate transporter substrate-binding protein [Burkholderiales bacterium]
MIRTIILALALAPTQLAAQAFPTKTVRIISPYPTGAGPDTVARLLAEKMAKSWGQQVLVEARPGGNGFIAIEAVKRGAPDGHEIVMVDSGHVAVNPSLFKRLPYDVDKDFAPAALIYRTDFLIAVAANGPYATVGQMLDAAKKQPGRISYGTPFVGSPSHLGSALLELRTGTQMVHVPFKETSQMTAAVANGDVGWTLTTLATAGPLVRAGKVKFIGVAAKSRLAAAPDVPTVQESGGPADYEVNAWVAWLVPKATPAGTVAAINREVNRVLGEADVRERMGTFGFTPLPSSPQALGDLIRADTSKYADLVRRTGATID